MLKIASRFVVTLYWSVDDDRHFVVTLYWSVDDNRRFVVTLYWSVDVTDISLLPCIGP